jgi:phosphate transport system substrate-binding protein
MKKTSREAMRAFVTRKKRLAGAVSVLLVAASAISAVSVSGAQARSGADELKGAGATFPAPLIAAWQQKYEAARGVKITYNPIGSGGGI